MREKLPEEFEVRHSPATALTAVAVAILAYLAVNGSQVNLGGTKEGAMPQLPNSGEIFNRLNHPFDGIQFPKGK